MHKSLLPTRFVENDLSQTFQHCIIKEEVILSDLEYLSETSEADDNDHEINNNNLSTNNKNFCENQINPSEPKEATLNLAIAKFGIAKCLKCSKSVRAVARQIRCKSCSSLYKYYCKSCLRSYKSFSDLRHHLKLKHDITGYQQHKCQDCGKSFAQKKSLTKHLKVCKKTIQESNSSNIFECKLCPYKSTHKGNFKVHIESKHENTCMNCEKCGKTYTDVKSLRRHRNIYCGKNKLIQCMHCTFKAYRKDQMARHLKLKHEELFEK